MEMSQQQVNQVWANEWKKQDYDARSLFRQRIFIEGYPVVKKYIPADAKMILDVGAATGRYSVKIAQDFPDAKIYATDILPDSLVIIDKLIKETGVNNVITQKEDATRLSFADNTFDVIYSGMVLQILPDIDAALGELRRVLKPGGILIMTTVNFWNFHTLFKTYIRIFNRPPEYYGTERAFSPRQLRALFSERGFDVMALDGFSPAYGIYRLKVYWAPAAFLGRLVSRINRILDSLTGRFFSRHFGFEIFCVSRKK